MIRIAQPQIGDEEEQAVLAALRSGRLAQGPRVAEFEEAFAEYLGARHAVAVSSGTAALVIALQAHGIGEGDEVLVPAFTFAASANAVLLAGARPLLTDIREDDYTIDLTGDLTGDIARAEAAVTSRTRAIVPVHLFGHPCDMTALRGFAEARDLLIVEDACQAIGASWRGATIGSRGTACFSFYATKSMTTGEGGMVVTDDGRVAEQARILRNQGEETRYLTALLSGNFRMTEIAAALGLAQLQKLDGWNERRRANAAWLSERLAGVVTPRERPDARHVYQQYTVRVPDGARNALRDSLREQEIEAIPYYERCLHQQPLYQKLGIGGSFPVAERAAQEVLSLPVHPALEKTDLEAIAAAVNGARALSGASRG
ncbi:MAG: DegT/DnrJ/EryC1/StrS family aminotransferase [Chloroflexi bacterium]|nr:DegT/DnrJ/EryC1/StrS family aminotransferase [Chloroflexota bacterium]